MPGAEVAVPEPESPGGAGSVAGSWEAALGPGASGEPGLGRGAGGAGGAVSQAAARWTRVAGSP